jgi:leucyl-tRNA synthetase
MVVHETYRRADGSWVTPAEVKITGEGDTRSAVDAATGEPIEIGPIEKMSKSKRNTIDPSTMIETYGADTVRWFMLSDSPPDRDLVLSEEGVAGAHRFVQRIWRAIREAGELGQRFAGTGESLPNELSADALQLRRMAHRTVAAVEDNIKALRFNVAVARIHELVNEVAAAVSRLSGMRPDQVDFSLGWAIREALERLVDIMAPMMPHLAEECWRALGRDGLVAERPWPEIDPSLLVEETITLPVQVNGKKRGELTIPIDASQADVETATLALDAVRRALDGNPPRKIVVVPKRIVNVVV